MVKHFISPIRYKHLFLRIMRGRFESPTMQWLQKVTWEQTHWNRYGCYYDDSRGGSHPELFPEIIEALRRFQIAEPDAYNERCFRIIRASQLAMNKTYLPVEEWTSWEEDQTKGRYLTPYVEEVEEEIAERDRWNKEHP